MSCGGGGWAMPCAQPARPECPNARAAGINVDRLTIEEAREVEDLVDRASTGTRFVSADVGRLCDLRRKAGPTAADLGFVDDCDGGHGRASIKKSHRAEGRNFVD